MYVAITGRGKARVVQFRHDYRIPGTNKKTTKVIKTIGNYEKLLAQDPDIISKLKDEARELTRQQREENAPIQLTVQNQQIKRPQDTQASFHIGHSVLQKLWQNLDLDSCIRRHCDKKNISSICTAIQSLLYHRLVCPSSVLASSKDIAEYAGIESLGLDVYYQALSVLDQLKDDLVQHFCDFFAKHTSRQGPMAYLDVTTHAFESTRQGELRMFGFSKDNKNKEVQVVMGLLIDNNGIPISFELFPGNTMDQATLVKAVEELKSKYRLNKIVVVADRGLNCQDNLVHLLNEGHSFVFAYTLKSSSQELQSLALDSSGWQAGQLNKSTGEILHMNKRLKHELSVKVELTEAEKAQYAGRRGRPRKYKQLLIPVWIHLTWDKQRAEKDRKDRERTIKKVKHMLDKPSLVKQSLKRGRNQYLDLDLASEKVSLDEEKIASQARFDGYYAIITNEEAYSTGQVCQLYGGLWQIEESFRVLKTDLAASPTFVWRNDRVRGHFTLCFMALCFIRYAQYLMSQGGQAKAASAARLMNALQRASVTVAGQYPDVRLSPFLLEQEYLYLIDLLKMKPLYTYMTPFEFRLATGLNLNKQLKEYYNRTE